MLELKDGVKNDWNEIEWSPRTPSVQTNIVL